MTVWLEILLLAVVQGIAEFLPISSSGHVLVGAALFDQFGQPLDEKLTVNVVLHLGTLLAILVFYWRRLVRLLGQDRRVIGLLVVGSVPIGVVGLVVKKSSIGPTLEAGLESALLAGLMFPITAALLVWASRRPQGDTACRELGYGSALLIGLLQAFAVLPGVSRSGATIAAGLGCGMRREEAAAFSFLLAIPAIAGAGLLETLDLAQHGAGSTHLGGLVAGGTVAFAVSLASLSWLVRWLKHGRLHLFAWYLVPLGAAVLLWQWTI
jgi:undecaprenyl-diphosphatase